MTINLQVLYTHNIYLGIAAKGTSWSRYCTGRCAYWRSR